MLQMATIGQIPYSEAVSIANYMSGFAPEARPDWISRHFVFPGYSGARFNLREEKEVEVEYAQRILGLLGDRLLLYAEPEFEVKFNAEEEVDAALEFMNLTYFLGDRLQITGGLILTDFNISNVRLHPMWINLSQDLPWARYFVPETTLGGKIGWNVTVGKATLYGTFFSGRETKTPYIEAENVVGARVGTFMPALELELGLSYAYIKEEKENVFGGYLVKRIGPGRIQGEFATSKEKGSTYWLEASSSLDFLGAVGERITPVIRWQQYSAKDLPPENVPQGDAQELYIGLNLDLLRSGPYLARLQAGYAFGFKAAEDKAKVSLIFRW